MARWIFVGTLSYTARIEVEVTVEGCETEIEIQSDDWEDVAV